MYKEMKASEAYTAQLERQVLLLEKERSDLQAQLAAYQSTARPDAIQDFLSRFLSDQILSHTDINLLLQKTVAELGKAMRVERCLLVEFDLEKPFENGSSGPGLSLSATTHVRFCYIAPGCSSSCLPDTALAFLPEITRASTTAQPLIYNDTKAPDLTTPPETSQLVRSWLGIPVLYGGRNVALLELSFENTPHNWTGEEIAMAQAVALRLGGAAGHARLTTQVQIEHRRAAAVISSIAEGVLAVDRTGRIVLVNPSLLRMLGGTEADWYGEFLHEKLPFMMDEVPTKTILYHCNVQERVFQVITSPLLGELWADAGLASVSILLDVTEEIRIARAKDNFLTLISHELRTPLTSISGALDILNDTDLGDLTTTQKEFLRVAIKNTYRLIGLLETTFDITRLETGHVRLDQGPVLLEEVIQRVMESSIMESFQHKRQNLRIDFSEAPRVYADPARLIQIFENLISNACKYTPRGGTIEVKSALTGDGQVSISVTDTGIGLSMQDQRHLFEKFFRVDHSLTREVGGSGLGLAITRSLVELHGSELYVESAPGKGSRFSFNLPTPY